MQERILWKITLGHHSDWLGLFSPARVSLKLFLWPPWPVGKFASHSRTLSLFYWGIVKLGFPSDSVVKNPPAVQETHVQSLDREDPLEEGISIHSSILAWRIPRIEEPWEFMVSHRVAKSIGSKVHRVAKSWTQLKWLSTAQHRVVSQYWVSFRCTAKQYVYTCLLLFSHSVIPNSCPTP